MLVEGNVTTGVPAALLAGKRFWESGIILAGGKPRSVFWLKNIVPPSMLPPVTLTIVCCHATVFIRVEPQLRPGRLPSTAFGSEARSRTCWRSLGGRCLRYRRSTGIV